ncbi:MAG: DNA adenine methylase [Deltaproteobacteria bacterium]|nr:DNA adenine methylase [Deltaproteobacteria bacterium]
MKNHRPKDQRLIYGDVVPIFRWAGSKRKNLDTLASFWSNRFDRYLEPFVGSACLFLRIKPGAAILGDLNPWLIETYRTIRHQPLEVAEALYEIPRDSATYYRVRKTPTRQGTAVHRAARLVYLNRNCFNGIFRTNLKGEFNVPFGTKQGQYPRRCDFENAANLLKSAKFPRRFS